MLDPGVKGDDDGDDDCIPLHNVTLSYGLFHYITQKHHVTSIALYYIKKTIRYITLYSTYTEFINMAATRLETGVK